MGEYVEYYYFPVMEPGELISIEPSIENFSSVAFTANKVRDCEWIKTEWFYGNPEGNNVQVSMFHGEEPQIRGVGEHFWENTKVYLDEERIRESSFAISTHKCHPFWTTKSLLYISSP